MLATRLKGSGWARSDGNSLLAKALLCWSLLGKAVLLGEKPDGGKTAGAEDPGKP